MKAHSKKKSMCIHFKRRFIQRHGITVNNKDITKMVAKIRRKRARFIKHQSQRVSVWDVMFRNKEYRVLYDKIRKTLITTIYTNIPMRR